MHIVRLSQGRNSSESAEAVSSSGEQEEVSRNGLGPFSFLSQQDQLSYLLADPRVLVGIALGARTEQQPHSGF